MIEKLKNYIKHDENCMAERGWGDGPCTCGAMEAFDNVERIYKNWVAAFYIYHDSITRGTELFYGEHPELRRRVPDDDTSKLIKWIMEKVSIIENTK